MRGSKTHGWGSMKKHRGGGHKGGRGMAGTGRKADSKKPSIWSNPDYFGRHGFVKYNARIITAVNVVDIDEKIERYVAEKKAKLENGTYFIDLKDIGFNKLLGKGKATKKLKITCSYASKKAIESVKNAGGEVILPK